MRPRGRRRSITATRRAAAEVAEKGGVPRVFVAGIRGGISEDHGVADSIGSEQQVGGAAEERGYGIDGARSSDWGRRRASWGSAATTTTGGLRSGPEQSSNDEERESTRQRDLKMAISCGSGEVDCA